MYEYAWIGQMDYSFKLFRVLHRNALRCQLVSHTWLDRSHLTAVKSEKKLARVLFEFGVVINATDDDCEQQISSIEHHLQQLTTPAVRRRSARLTTAVAWRHVEQEAVLIY